jgi:hypothetical protein
VGSRGDGFWRSQFGAHATKIVTQPGFALVESVGAKRKAGALGCSLCGCARRGSCRHFCHCRGISPAKRQKQSAAEARQVSSHSGQDGVARENVDPRYRRQVHPEGAIEMLSQIEARFHFGSACCAEPWAGERVWLGFSNCSNCFSISRSRCQRSWE